MARTVRKSSLALILIIPACLPDNSCWHFSMICYTGDMKRTLLITMISLCMFSIASAEPFIINEGAPITSAGPRIAVTEPSYYFGVVGPDRELKHTFVFRNDGIEDLIIHKVSPP